MNCNFSTRVMKLVYAAACTILFASTSHAGTFGFHVDVNTLSLVGNAGAPFSLDFQLNGTGNNTATLLNFSFLNGNPLTDPIFGPGYVNGASGTLGSSVVLTDAGNTF